MVKSHPFASSIARYSVTGIAGASYVEVKGIELYRGAELLGLAVSALYFSVPTGRWEVFGDEKKVMLPGIALDHIEWIKQVDELLENHFESPMSVLVTRLSRDNPSRKTKANPYRSAVISMPSSAALMNGGKMKGVLLAHKWSGGDPTGYWMSEKLDGVRAYWTGEKLITRNGNEIHAPEWFLNSLPSIALDGELFAGRGEFQKTVSIVRKKKPVDSEWRSMHYRVFDAPEVPGPVEKRWAAMNKAIRGKKHVETVEQVKCKGESHLRQYHKKIRKQGGEGVMLREPNSRYEGKRSHTLLKVKDFEDTEAKIVGYTPGTGKHKGKLGAYEVVLVDDKSIRFKVGTGISDAERERPLKIGKIITIKHQGVSKAGVPRFPALITARDYEN
jgi:DNA ligase-1